MSSILSKDTSLRFPHSIVVSASAGSGKTWALTHRLVQFLLSTHIPGNGLRSILAITFTNNAALDMKRRVLGLLKRAALGDKDTLRELRDLVALNDEDLQLRARHVLENVLENYSDFQVRTIDSFLSRIFKASAIQFGFSPGFNVVIDSRPLLDEAFEWFAGEVKEGSPASELMANLIERLVIARSSKGRFPWNPYRDLSREVKKLYARIVSTAKPLVGEDQSGQFLAKGKELAKLILELGKAVDGSGLDASVAFQKYHAEAAAGKLDRLIDLKFPEPVKKGKSSPMALGKFSRSTSALCDEIGRIRRELVVIHAETYFQPYIETHRMLQGTLDRVKRRRGELDLADITLRLAQFLEEGNVPDVYLSLGEGIAHYLIDEFQDTAPIQWQTLVPLIENSLSSSGSLFVVGDLKQSIYGFRGADWRIMRELMEGAFFPSAPPDILTLEMNYRSHERILSFSKEVFQKIVPLQIPGEATEASGLSTFRQEVRKTWKGKGYVETVTIEGDPDERPEREAILSVVRSCLERGFSPRDLLILTPENEDVVKVSGWLNEANIDFIPFSTLDIRTRKIIGELLALLRFLESPIDDLSFATFLIGDLFGARLAKDKAGIISQDLHAFLFDQRKRPPPRRALYTLFRERYPELWKKYFDALFGLTGYLPLYDLTTQIYKRLGVFELVVDEEGALVKLLEVVKDFEEQGRNSLKEFIGFAEEISEDSDWNMDVPSDVDAIRIMTVHKAKGLDERVVIVLLYDVAMRNDRVYMEETEEGVRLIRIVNKDEEEDELLAERIKERELRARVDQLNKLYVALTRAREEMYVVSVKYPNAREPSAFLPPTGFEPAKKPPVTATPRPLEAAAALFHHTRGISEHTEAPERIHFEEVRRGDAIHSILARIDFVDANPAGEVSRSVREELAEGRSTFDQSAIEKTILKFLSTPGVKDWFRRGKDRRVLNEQEFARGDGQLFRMDRVIIDRASVTVMDYKTGDEQKEYEEQVRNYMTILGEVFPHQELVGVLAYVDKGILRRVWEAQ